MSGHSHFRTIQHKKELEDQKRGKVFSKLSKMIAFAAKEGADPDKNSKLKQVIEEAKRFNLPKENIERAIKRGANANNKDSLERVVYEALGPEGSAFVIEGITDNKNRMLSEIKQVLQKYNLKLAGEGSVLWLFEEKGIIRLKKTCESSEEKEKAELTAIECGAEDLCWDKNNSLCIYTKPFEIEKVKKALIDKGLEILSSILGWKAKQKISLNEKEGEKCRLFLSELSKNEDVQNIYDNLKN